ncbi:MAG: hypothetical protein CMM15_14515, partial [Rhodospirillaceae bacterium]|nr:hypothetical protein [Rhodospirillaceae bacterium]
LQSGASIIPSEGQKVRTSFYNSKVICDWKITQSPEANSFNVAITAHPGWFAVLQPLLGTILLPEMVGAYGDLSQEDHVAIQTCLDYFENNEIYGNVQADRKYLVGDTIKARAYSSMVCSGEFKAKDQLNKPVLDFYAQYPIRKIENVKWKGFFIDGNKTNQTSTSDNILGSGLSIRCDVENPATNGDAQHRGEFENIEISDILSNNCLINGIYIGKVTFSGREYSFDNLRGSGSVNGLFVDNYCEYITFTRIGFSLNGYGLRDNGASNLSFLSGDLCNNTEAGAYIEKTGRNASKKIISGLRINHNKRGVWLGDGVGSSGRKVDQILITDNHILANARQGIIGVGGDDVIARDNIFSGNGYESPNTYDDIYIGPLCSRWDVYNKHQNSTGETRYAVYYENQAPNGKDSHRYHRIDGTFEGFSEPISYTPFGDPTAISLNSNTSIIQGVFEYWNTAGSPPSESAGNAKANVDLTKIPLGTICVNNADSSGGEQWLAIKAPSSSGSNLGVTFKRLANYP